MKIKNQFLYSISIFVVIISIIAASVFVTEQQKLQLNNQENLAQGIQTHASDLSYLSNDYFLYQEDSGLTLWKAEYTSLSIDLSKIRVSNLEQHTLLENIKDDAGRLNNSFAVVVSYLQNADRNQSIRIMPVFQADWSIMTAQNQALIFDSQQLSQAFRNHADQLTFSSIVLIFVVLGLFAAYFVTNYLITYRNTLKSISELQAGIAVVGLGNLEHTLKIGKKDEIGEISQSFNRMTANLREVTASKTDLEREIEERKKLEQKNRQLFEIVQQERDKLSSLINSMTDEVWYADADKNITLTNPSAAREFGLDSLGKRGIKEIASSFEVYRSDGTPRPAEEAPPLRALSGEIIRNEEEVVKMPTSGEMHYRQVNAAPVRDAQGNIVGSVSVVRDITNLKKNELALRQRKEELEKLQEKLEDKAAEVEEYATRMEELAEDRANKLKDAERLAAVGATAGMVGHDIRNPLQAITSDVYLTKNELASMPDGEQKTTVFENLDEIEKNIGYINKIVGDLQDYARPLRAISKATDIEEICKEIIRKSNIPDNIKIMFSFEKDAKEAFVDDSMVKRIFSNLIINATQAMPEGGTLSIHGQRKGSNIAVSVEDTGSGIPEEIKPKLFTPLFTTKSKGQGFGLAVVKRLTEALDGEVTLDSKKGKGTTFTIKLPAVEEKDRSDRSN